jgi:hypothetical protein
MMLISYIFVSFCSGMGAASYFILRKESKRWWEAQADIDLMYRLHKMEPPRVGREKMRDALNKFK